MSRLRHHRLRQAPLVAALGLLVALSGCQRDGDSALAVEGADKVNAYIACFNGVEQPVQESFQQYVTWKGSGSRPHRQGSHRAWPRHRALAPRGGLR